MLAHGSEWAIVRRPNPAIFVTPRIGFPQEQYIAMTGFHTGLAAPHAAGQNDKDKRDRRIDFFRGLALIFIFVDHLPNNKLSFATMQAFAFADAAEVFFFLSGFVAALVYGSTLMQDGFIAAARRIYRRAWVLYAAQQILLLLMALVVAAGTLETGVRYHDVFRIGALFQHPAIAGLHAATLRFQPAYMDILPVYIVFLGLFPIVLAALQRNVWLALIPSAALYVAVQIWGPNLSVYPGGGGWFFNPLAWQFIFVLGASFGTARYLGKKPLPNSRIVTGLALGVCAAIAAVKLGQLPLPTEWAAKDGLDKTAMAPLRLVSFFALLLAVRQLAPAGATLKRLWLGQQLIRCGQFSLQIFCLGTVLAVIGHMVLMTFGNSVAAQTAVSLAGIAAMFVFAAILERRRQDAFAIRAVKAAQGARS